MNIYLNLIEMPQTYFRQVYITSNYSHHIETEQDEPQFIIAALILLYVSTLPESRLMVIYSIERLCSITWLGVGTITWLCSGQ